MPSTKQRVIKASDLTEDQLASASDFLTGNDWRENEDSRIISRSDVAKLIAWYGALRFLAGTDGIGTLEKPPRLLQSNGKPVTQSKTDEFVNDFELIEIADVTVRSL
jgi:hypothetical protein